jgi:hypothetical protein
MNVQKVIYSEKGNPLLVINGAKFLAAAEFLPAVRKSQVLLQVVNGKGLGLVIRMIG